MSWWWWFGIAYIGLIFGFMYLWASWMNVRRFRSKADAEEYERESIKAEQEHWRQWREKRNNKGQ